MGKRKKRARRNLEKRETKSLIDEEKTGSERNNSEQPKGHLPVASTVLSNSPALASESQANNPQKTTQHRHYIVRPIVAIWKFLTYIWRSPIRSLFGFCDKHDGSITALATVAIVILTAFYVGYSKSQWEAIKESNAISRQALQISERAYVRIGLPTFDRHTSMWKIPLINTGHITSPGASVGIAVTLGSIDGKRMESFYERHFGGDGTRIPPGTDFITIGIFTPFSESAKSEILAGTKRITIRGDILYKTGFGDAQDEFPFCFSYNINPADMWWACTVDEANLNSLRETAKKKTEPEPDSRHTQK